MQPTNLSDSTGTVRIPRSRARRVDGSAADDIVCMHAHSLSQPPSFLRLPCFDEAPVARVPCGSFDFTGRRDAAGVLGVARWGMAVLPYMTCGWVGETGLSKLTA
jgi:hypothetical protein